MPRRVLVAEGVFLLALVATSLFAIALAVAVRQPVQAQPVLSSWKVDACWTNDCVARRLNSLSPERAAEAKLTTWENQTYVWYRLGGER